MIVRDFPDSIALVTGSTASIGFEIARQLARAGVCRIMLNGRDPDRGAAACDEIRALAPGCDARFTAADPNVQAEAQALVAATVEAFGALDILVNSVGGAISPRPFHELPAEAIDGIIRAHLANCIYMSHAALPHLMARQGGTIVTISSDAAKIATPGEAVVGAGKAGQVMFTRTLALEAARHGVRVHAVTPSIVRDTRSYERVMAEDFSRRLFEKAERRAHLGVVSPADIAPLVVFLASPAAAKITGQAISVNGAISAA